MTHARICLVRFADPDGLQHSVEVPAESLYEAAALALRAFRDARMFPCPPGEYAQLEIQVTEPAVVHYLTVRKLQHWLESAGKTPREQALKQRLRELLT